MTAAGGGGERRRGPVAQWAQQVSQAVRAAFYGKDEVTEKVLVALLCRGHVLLEDVPGVGKTVLARALANTVGGMFKQVQCTPDLLPADVLGVSIYNPQSGEFTFREGPIITNLLLVDEINRATPRTQSALLEAMAEGQISVEGTSRPLPDPFFLIATESPGDAEGTFPLPEVQKDRFFMTVSIGYPDREAERAVMSIGRLPRHPLTRIRPVADLDTLREMQQRVLQVHVDESLRAYILALVGATRRDRRLALGVSPRGSLALYKAAQALAALRDRDYVTPEDIQEVAGPVLRKRIILQAEGQAQRTGEEELIAGIIDAVGVPPLSDAL